MAVALEGVSAPPLEQISVFAPPGAVIGVIGADGGGKRTLLRIVAGDLKPVRGSVEAAAPRKYLGEADPISLDGASTVSLYHTLAAKDACARAGAAMELELFRRRGGTALLVSHEPDLVRWLCDEVWWLDGGRLRAKGDPREVLDAYQQSVVERLRGASGTLATAAPYRCGKAAPPWLSA
jgi:ABC-type polysaccharide/polyol phosphate transport system ATPase subunit